MDFDLSEEQRLIKDSVTRLLRTEYGFEAREKHRAEAAGFSEKLWASFAELGLLAIPFDEADGGLGAGPVETMIVMEAFGRALVVEPYLASVVMAGAALRHAGSPEQRAEWLPGIVDGSSRLAFAFAERGTRYDLSQIAMRATPEDDGFRLSGEKTLVLHGDTATGFVVAARTAGEAGEAEGLGLFLVPADAEGLSRRGFPTQDGMRAAELSFADVRVPKEAVLGEPGAAAATIARIEAEAIAALCAEAVGSMERMVELTVAYIKERKQFGVPIAAFQVLQHKAAEMYIALEQARSMAIFAAMNAAESDEGARRTAMAAAKVQIGRSGRFIAQTAVQLHGGVGVTMEYEIAHHFKRQAMIDLSFGDADHHQQIVAAEGGLDDR
ncbi:acyl-CoA dehydrogenase family protein [Jiella sonneratiae]|uniref:Acyl-CoA dehydrogenase family protein n=1 Tax=Jiella sonneratiae TaxID=2816856 RepID=A0ABS3J5Z9_9HYPH|nr:acyl-CoA dehydrogenase [Jiella sonneratiae]MBO0904570.1 acyl-CoA dehydrogenase family protein [Jiella sonneratiae]